MDLGQLEVISEIRLTRNEFLQKVLSQTKLRLNTLDVYLHLKRMGFVLARFPRNSLDDSSAPRRVKKQALELDSLAILDYLVWNPDKVSGFKKSMPGTPDFVIVIQSYVGLEASCF
jgi:hypothetical protein